MKSVPWFSTIIDT